MTHTSLPLLTGIPLRHALQCYHATTGAVVRVFPDGAPQLFGIPPDHIGYNGREFRVPASLWPELRDTIIASVQARKATHH